LYTRQRANQRSTGEVNCVGNTLYHAVSSQDFNRFANNDRKDESLNE